MVKGELFCGIDILDKRAAMAVSIVQKQNYLLCIKRKEQAIDVVMCDSTGDQQKSI